MNFFVEKASQEAGNGKYLKTMHLNSHVLYRTKGEYMMLTAEAATFFTRKFTKTSAFQSASLISSAKLVLAELAELVYATLLCRVILLPILRGCKVVCNKRSIEFCEGFVCKQHTLVRLQPESPDELLGGTAPICHNESIKTMLDVTSSTKDWRRLHPTKSRAASNCVEKQVVIESEK